MASDKKPQIPLSTKKKIDKILAAVLKEVKPSEKEMRLATSYANEIMTRLKRIAPKNVEIISVGSVARGTQMRGTSDIDIFLLFPRNIPEKRMEKQGMEIAKKVVSKKKNESFMIKYAEHPYLMLLLNDVGIKADIVPAFKIKDSSERITAVDRSQLHNVFVNERLSRRQKDDVILLKAFLKAHGIYGAGARFEGFSGYLCELLIYHYGSFTDALYRISRIKLPLALRPISRAEFGDDSPEIKVFIKKFNKQFIVTDPTDPNRNVAAVVTNEALARFSLASRMFLKNPSTELFYGPKYSDAYSERKLMGIKKELGLDIHVLHFKIPDIAEDIIWQQIRKFGNGIAAALRKEGFAPALWFENVGKDDAIIALFLPSSKISHAVVDGPSVFMGTSTDKFLESHKGAHGVVLKDDRVGVIEESKYKTPKEVIENMLKNAEMIPSHVKKEQIKLHVNDMPEPVAKLLYEAFIRKTSI